MGWDLQRLHKVNTVSRKIDRQNQKYILPDSQKINKQDRKNVPKLLFLIFY